MVPDRLTPITQTTLMKITGENGKSIERVVATKKNSDGTVTRIIEVTKPDGTKETRTETIGATSDSPAK